MFETESELVGGLKRGDPSAFHRLVDLYARRLYGLAYSLLGDRSDAEDVVQETLAGVFRSAPSFQQRSSLWTWLARILVRHAARARRSNRSHRAIRLDAGGDREEMDRTSDPPDPISRIAGADAQIDFAAALATLSDGFRQIIVLREIEQMSYEEISQVLVIPLGTVESRLYRARLELRQRLAVWRR